MKRENEQLSAAIQELNENVVRNTASQNPSIPKLTNHIKDLTKVIFKYFFSEQLLFLNSLI